MDFSLINGNVYITIIMFAFDGSIAMEALRKSCSSSLYTCPFGGKKQEKWETGPRFKSKNFCCTFQIKILWFLVVRRGKKVPEREWRTKKRNKNKSKLFKKKTFLKYYEQCQGTVNKFDKNPAIVVYTWYSQGSFWHVNLPQVPDKQDKGVIATVALTHPPSCGKHPPPEDGVYRRCTEFLWHLWHSSDSQ